MNLLPTDDLRLLDTHLCAVLAGRFDRASNGFNDALCGYVLNGGKRIRPQLTLWAYRAAGGDGLPKPLLDLASAWELFHAFLLAHDDIIDASDSRRGRPSLHCELANLDHGSPAFGRGLAIVAGDLLFSTAMRLVHGLDLPDPAYRNVAKLFSDIACTTGFGQAIDICQSSVPLDDVCEATLLREYDWKTAAYTFEGPMLSGARVAGISDDAATAVSAFAAAVGRAYQLHNDLIDLAAPAHEGCDLVQGKRTMTLLRARLKMDDASRASFDRRLNAISTANGQAVALAEDLRQELQAVGAVAATQEMIDFSLAHAAASAADSSLSPTFRAELQKLLHVLRSQYFAHA